MGEAAGPKYKAFISYSRVDREVAIALQDRLERFILPKGLEIQTRHALKPGFRPLNPIFRDQDELVPGHDLSERITKSLVASEYLIVICSRASSRSEWVEKEVATFVALGRAKDILAVVVDGEPRAASRGLDPALECLPASLLKVEPAWVDWRQTGKAQHGSFLQLVAALLALDSLDELVQRDVRRRRNLLLTRAAVVLSLALAGSTGLALLGMGRAATMADIALDASSQALATGDAEAAARFAVLAFGYQDQPETRAAITAAVVGSRRLGLPIDGPAADLDYLAFLPDGRLLTGIWRYERDSPGPQIWNISSNAPVVEDGIGSTLANAYHFAVQPNGLIVFADDAGIGVIESVTGAPLYPRVEPVGAYRGPPSISLSDAGDILAIGGADALALWRTRDARQMMFIEYGYHVYKVVLSPNGSRVAFLIEGGAVQISRTDNGLALGQVLSNNAVDMVFSPDSARFAVADGNVVRFYLSEDGLVDSNYPILTHPSEISAIAVDRSDELFAVGTVDGSIRVWEAGEYGGSEFYDLRGHRGRVGILTFSPDGRKLVSVSFEAETGDEETSPEIRIWDVSPRPQAPTPAVAGADSGYDASSACTRVIPGRLAEFTPSERAALRRRGVSLPQSACTNRTGFIGLIRRLGLQ